MSQEVVKIGYSGPMSGGAAQYGKNVLDGMQMAVSEINAAAPEIGGKKVKIEIVPLDDKDFLGQRRAGGGHGGAGQGQRAHPAAGQWCECCHVCLLG